MINKEEILNNLDIMIPDPVCELEYNKDYELLISTVMAAQSTDKRVNKVAKDLWNKYDLVTLSMANLDEIETIIRSVGTYSRKAKYIKTIAESLLANYDGKVPNSREYLESLPGVGRKTTNVVLNEIYDVPAIAVDTHVSRVSKRLEIANLEDDVLTIEQKIMKMFPENTWGRLHKQLVLFGRYTCKSSNPDCTNCLFNKKCKYKKID